MTFSGCAGAEMRLSGRASPQRSLLELQGIVAGGVLFADTPMKDVAEVKVGVVMIHHVERGSDGDAKELRRGDFVEAVNGERPASLDDLHEMLRSATEGVTLTLKRYSGGDRVFVYLERTLRIEALERITQGGQSHRIATVPGAESVPAHGS